MFMLTLAYRGEVSKWSQRGGLENRLGFAPVGSNPTLPAITNLRIMQK